MDEPRRRLVIDDPDTLDRIEAHARALGVSAEEAVRRCLGGEVRHDSGTGKVSPEERARRMAAIRRAQEAIAKLPVLDDRPADEIIGYNEHGHFD